MATKAHGFIASVKKYILSSKLETKTNTCYPCQLEKTQYIWMYWNTVHFWNQSQYKVKILLCDPMLLAIQTWRNINQVMNCKKANTSSSMKSPKTFLSSTRPVWKTFLSSEFWDVVPKTLPKTENSVQCHEKWILLQIMPICILCIQPPNKICYGLICFITSWFLFSYFTYESSRCEIIAKPK